MSKLKAHPYADLFPMMTSLELEALTADVKENGLHHPIVLYQGNVLDGRNRLLACERAGVEPTFSEYKGDDSGAFALVISENIQRRDLTQAQRAVVAARALDRMPERRGGDRKSKVVGPTTLSREAVARVFKVGPQSVQQARAVLTEAPDLADRVEVCTLSLAAAYEQLQQRLKQARQKEKDAARIAEFKDAISSGEMTMEEALQQAIQQEREEKEKIAAEADARKTWLEQLVSYVKWVETYVSQYSDDFLIWYTKPDSPGLFDHGLSADRLADVIGQLERVRVFTFNGDSLNGQSRSSAEGSRTA